MSDQDPNCLYRRSWSSKFKFRFTGRLIQLFFKEDKNYNFNINLNISISLWDLAFYVATAVLFGVAAYILYVNLLS